MEAKDTIIDINQWLDRNGIDRAFKKDMKKTYDAIKGDLEAQAEISFKAGIKEVVDDMEKVMSHISSGQRIATFEKVLEKWQAKLKEWELWRGKPSSRG